MKLFLAILMGVIAIIFLFFAGFADKVAMAFTYVLLAALSMFVSFYFYFGNMKLQ